MAANSLTVGSRRLGGELWKLPSGAEATIRGLEVKHFDKLGNRKKLKSGAAYNEILEDRVGLDPMKAFIGDRVFSLVAIRIETLGPDFSFRCKCPDCGHQFMKAVNLESLAVQELAHGPGPFALTLPKSGKKITWRLLAGADEQRMAQEFAEEVEEQGASLSLAMRTTAIEGEPMVALKFFEKLAGADAEAMWADINEKDCGVVTSVEIECPKCESVNDINLPLDPTFLLPPKRVKKK